MLYVVTYMCTIVGAYSCAVDANQCVRSLRRVGSTRSLIVQYCSTVRLQGVTAPVIIEKNYASFHHIIPYLRRVLTYTYLYRYKYDCSILHSMPF